LKRGYEEELWFKKKLEKEGWSVTRNPASLGPYDLIAFKNNCIKLIQVKATKRNTFYFNNLSREEWRELSERPNDSYFVVIFKRGRGKRRVIRVVKVDSLKPPKKIEYMEDSKWQDHLLN